MSLRGAFFATRQSRLLPPWAKRSNLVCHPLGDEAISFVTPLGGEAIPEQINHLAQLRS